MPKASLFKNETKHLPFFEKRKKNAEFVEGKLIHPKNPWDVGFRVSSCHLF